ncbi:hypothetical protein KPL70_025946 [Citrus sinensis]|nr:hypothetical protein KPL70_025946 [Citrus sinensis]
MGEIRIAYKASHFMVLLVFKESYLTLDDTNSPLPSIVTSLLLEFEDVFIEEMPIGLPPITVHSKTLDEHIEHLQCVLDVLRKEKLYANYKKCTFCVEKVVFLSFVVSANGIEMDQEKVRAIRAWPMPKSIAKVTLEIPSELLSNWKQEGYTHLHLGGIRLILTLHGRKGLPVTARIAMLDTRFKQYQDVVIGTVLTTLHAGSVLLTFYPNFNLSLQDPNLPTTLKIPTIIQIPRQISHHELIKLMPLEWISNYEQFHNNTAPIQTSESMFERRQDGTVRMTFKPPPSAPQEPPRLSFIYSSMITAVQTAQEDLPISGFNSEGYPVYPAKQNGHFLWDAPGSGMCDPTCPYWDDWDEDNDYATTRKKKPKRKKPPASCHHYDPKPPQDPPPPPAPLPFYQKELKWIAKHCKSENPSPIPQPLTFLNWQTQNARAQNDTLLNINSKVENISLRTEQLETKVDSISAQMQQIHQNLQSRITQLDSELRAMLAQRYYGPEFDQKEREIRRLKAELDQIESEKQRPTLFTTSPPIPSIGPTYHPFASILSPIRQYDPSKLFGITHTLFRDNPLPPPSKPKPKPKPQPRPVTFHPSSITILGHHSLGHTPASPPVPPPPTESQPPSQSKDKQPMHQFSAHTVDHSSTTDDQTSDSNLAISDSHTETDTESSVSTSDSEKSYADITRILMAQPNQPPQGQTSHIEPYVDIPSEVEEEMPESSATNQPPPAQAHTSSPSQKSSNGPWFTFDDLSSHKWRDRLNEMSAWIDLQMLRPGATTQSVLREFATGFTSALRDWFDSLGNYRQLQFVQLPEVSSALAVIHDQFLGDPSAVFEAARRDYLNMKCCSLNAKDLDFHYKRMSLLFYKLNGFNEPILKHVFLASLPDELQPDIQRQFTASNLVLDNISLGKIFQLAKTCLDKLYLVDPESLIDSSERSHLLPETLNGENQADASSARRKAIMPKTVPTSEKNLFGSHDEHRQLLTQFYDIVQSHGIMLSAKKSTIATDNIEFLDASDDSWGAILLEDINRKEHFIAYASGQFSDTQKHYHSVFKEILAVKNGIKKFEYHLIGHHFLIRMDSSAFQNILNFKDKATSLTWTLLKWFSPIPWWRKKLQQLSEIYNLERMPAPEAQLFTSVFIIHRPYFQHPDTNLFWTQDQVYEWFTAPHPVVIDNEIQDVLHNYLCQLNHQPPPLKDIFHTSLGPQHDLLMIPTPSAISKPKSTGIIIKEERPDYTDFLYQDSQDPWEDFLPLSQHLQQFPQPSMNEPGSSSQPPKADTATKPSKVDKATQTSPRPGYRRDCLYPLAVVPTVSIQSSPKPFFQNPTVTLTPMKPKAHPKTIT